MYHVRVLIRPALDLNYTELTEALNYSQSTSIYSIVNFANKTIILIYCNSSTVSSNHSLFKVIWFAWSIVTMPYYMVKYGTFCCAIIVRVTSVLNIHTNSAGAAITRHSTVCSEIECDWPTSRNTQ